MPLPRHWLLRALQLETDREQDPDHLSREAVRAFRAALEEAWTAEAAPEAARHSLHAYAARLRRARPSAASLAARLAPCVAALEQDRAAALASVDAVLASAEQASERLVEAAAALLRPGMRLLTYGAGAELIRVVTRCGDRLERVTACESRPRNEGARLAAAVADLAIPVRLITEAALELYVPECDLALVEADRILTSGDVVAQTGTAVLARVCAAHRVPLYVLADRSRWVPEGDELARFTRERRSPSEVLAEPLPGVEVPNIAFDLTPAALVAGIITGDG